MHCDDVVSEKEKTKEEGRRGKVSGREKGESRYTQPFTPVFSPLTTAPILFWFKYVVIRVQKLRVCAKISWNHSESSQNESSQVLAKNKLNLQNSEYRDQIQMRVIYEKKGETRLEKKKKKKHHRIRRRSEKWIFVHMRSGREGEYRLSSSLLP